MNEPVDVHIVAKYEKYKGVIEQFTEARIIKRYHRLLMGAQGFIQGMGYNGHVVCNETMLMFAVLGYYSDIMRLKDFHRIDRTNDSKVFAFETSWLLKRRPLQVKDSNDQKYAFCNEKFALSQIMLWLKEGENKNDAGVLAYKDLKFFSDTLFYHLKYRNYDPQTLELMLVSFMAGRKYQYHLSKKSGNSNLQAE
jgi:hypothetical protein